jgi:hypothetical protein
MVLKTTKTRFCTSLIATCILSFFLCQDGVGAEAVSFKEGSLSVNVKETSLLEVARDIEKQSGIWFRGDETFFQEKVSVTFSNLPFEEGLKRILTNLNYSLIFDAKNKVAGVMVMGEGTPAVAQPARPGAPTRRVATPPASTTRPSATVRPRPSTSTSRPGTTVRRPPRALPQTAPGGAATQPPGSAAPQSAIPEAFRGQENVPAPGGPGASDSPLPPAFRVTDTPPTPPVPVPDKETQDATRAVRNVQPPGGTPQGAAANPGVSKPDAGAPAPAESTKNDSTP